MNAPSQNKILFVGLNTIDLQFLVAEFPEHNTKTKADKNEIYVGGPATNAAIACAHLGGNVELLTPVGLHPFSDFIFEDLRKYDICLLDPVSGRESQAVFASIITSAKNGERTIYSYHPEFELPEYNYINLDFNNYALVLFDGFYPELAIPIARKCKEIGLPTLLDGGSWKPQLRDLIGFIDIAICSNDFTVPSLNEKNGVFDYLHEQGVKQAAVTRGAEAIAWSEKNGAGEIAVDQVKVVDSLGAGDIFHGAFCYYFAAGESFTKSLALASKIASLSCQTIGTRQWMRLV